MKTPQVEKMENLGVSSGAREGAFSPTPVDLAQLKNEIERRLQKLERDIYYDTLEFSNMIESITREAVQKVLRANAIEVMHEYDEIPDIDQVLERSITLSKTVRLEDIKSTDRVVVELELTNKKTIIIEFYMRYKARYLEVNNITMQKLLEPPEIRKIEAEEIEVGE
jgi:hypothetical protein